MSKVSYNNAPICGYLSLHVIEKISNPEDMELMNMLYEQRTLALEEALNQEELVPQRETSFFSRVIGRASKGEVKRGNSSSSRSPPLKSSKGNVQKSPSLKVSGSPSPKISSSSSMSPEINSPARKSSKFFKKPKSPTSCPSNYSADKEPAVRNLMIKGIEGYGLSPRGINDHEWEIETESPKTTRELKKKTSIFKRSSRTKISFSSQEDVLSSPPREVAKEEEPKYKFYMKRNISSSSENDENSVVQMELQDSQSKKKEEKDN